MLLQQRQSSRDGTEKKTRSRRAIQITPGPESICCPGQLRDEGGTGEG